jgi:hypothetical protein
MGTYRQPASLVDTQSGALSRQATKEGFDAIGLIAKASIAQAEERKKKEAETENAKKAILEAGAKRRAEGDAIINKDPVDAASLDNGVSNLVKAWQNAQIENLSLSSSDPRYTENLTKIAKADTFLNNLKDLMTSAVFTEKEVQAALEKGIGTGGGQISSASVTPEWVGFNSQTRSVSTGWKASFDISPDEDGNWGMYIIGKKGDSTLKRAVNMLSEDDETGTKYNKGTYRIVPDASAEVKVVLKEDGTLTRDGGISDRYATKTQETIGSEVYDITRIDRDQLFNQTSTVANVIGENIISNGANSMVDYVNSKGVKDPNNPKSNALGFISLKVDQNNNFVQENGEVVKGDWVQVTDDNGQLVQDLSFKEDTGYLSSEQYDAFMQFVQINTAADLGVFAPEQRVLDGAATESLRKSRADMAKPPSLTDKQEIQNFNLTEINKYKERQLDELPWGQKFKVDEVDVNKANTMLAETLNGLSYVGDLTGTLEVKYVEKPTGIGGKAGLDGFIEVYRISNTKRTKEGEFKLSDGGQMESFDQYLNKNLYGKVGLTNKTNAY